MNDTFMKEKPVFGLVLSMSLPMVLSMMVNALYNIVDSYFVARISEDAMTALSLVYPVQNLISATAIGFGVGINAVIAFFLGAGDKKKANQAATMGMFWSLVQGLTLSIVCILIMPKFLTLFTDDATVSDYAIRYSRIAFLFGMIISSGLSFEKTFQAVGRMKVSMLSMMAGCISNIVLDPILIFGLGPFPAMGIEGAALATGAGQVITLVIYIIIYMVKPIPVKICISGVSFKGGISRRLYSIGVPAILNMALPSLLISALNGILAEFSHVLVLGAYYKLQTFLYLTSSGIVQGIRPLIGYNYGAREYDRVHRIYRTALGMSLVVMIVGTVLCLSIPGSLIGIFTSSAETVVIGKTALRIISGGFIISAVSVTSCGALEGLNMGFPSLLISMLRYILIIIPAAWITAGVAWLIYKKKTSWEK